MPVHVPWFTLSVEPSCVVPLITGGVVLTGGSAVVTELAGDVAVAEPALLVAVTLTRVSCPTSAAVRS